MNDLRFYNQLFSAGVAVILPTPEQTLILRACLQPESPARAAWREWQKRREEFGQSAISDIEGVKILAPLLFTSARSHGFEIDKETRTFLRAAYVREEMRNRIFRRICSAVLLAFEKAGLPALVLKGTALAETVYDSPVLRHCHDIDILLAVEEMNRATLLLQSLDFRLTYRQIAAQRGDVRMDHESDLPLELHSSLFQIPYYDLPVSEIWARSWSCEIVGIGARILSPPDNLLHVCGHAFYSRGRSLLRWVSDAWFIIERHPDLDWDLLLRAASQSRMTVPLYVTLAYLAESLQARVPTTLLERLGDGVRAADALEREVAMRGALAAVPGGSIGFVHRITDWRERLCFVCRVLFPSPAYLCTVEQVGRSWLLPLHYIFRPVRSVIRTLWFLSKHRARRVREILMSVRTAP
jgi:hypothetical protein